MYNNKKILIFGMILLFTMIFVSAQPPFQTESLDFTEGLVIYTPLQYHFVANQDHIFNFQVFNKTNGVPFTNSSVNCSFMLIDDQGNFTYTLSKAGYIGNAFKISVTAGNFTEGHYNYGIKCVSIAGTVGGMKPTEFEVTEGGVDFESEGRSNLTIGLLAILVFLLFVSLYAMFNVENYIGKFTLYWVSHLLLTLITFIGWQIGVEGVLSAVALTGIFKIMFWVLIIAVTPMMIASISWIVYIHTYNEHFQKLIEKGYDTEEAFRIMDKKKGWMHGN